MKYQWLGEIHSPGIVEKASVGFETVKGKEVKIFGVIAKNKRVEGDEDSNFAA